MYGIIKKFFDGSENKSDNSSGSVFNGTEKLYFGAHLRAKYKATSIPKPEQRRDVKKAVFDAVKVVDKQESPQKAGQTESLEDLALRSEEDTYESFEGSDSISVGDTSLNSWSDLQENLYPFEKLMIHLRSSSLDPEFYLINNPDLLGSLFKEDADGMIDAMKARAYELRENIKTWVQNRERATARLSEIDALIVKLEGAEERAGDEDVLFSKIVERLREYETSFSITPYEDLCKAAILFDSGDDFAALFEKESLEFKLKDLAHPENGDIHKSDGKALAACIDRRLKKYCTSRQKQAINALAKGLGNTVFVSNQGDLTPEQLYGRAMSTKEGPPLIRQWLTVNINQNWGGKDGGALQRDLPLHEKERLLAELDFYGRSDAGLTQWLSTPQNQERLHCLKESLVLAHCQYGIKGITDHIESIAEPENNPSFTGQMAWCNRCKAMLLAFGSAMSKEMLKEVDDISSVLQGLAIRDVVRTGCIGHEPVYHLPAALSPDNCEQQSYLKEESKAVKQVLFDLVKMKNRPLREVSIKDEAALKDRFLKAQMELLFSHAKAKVGEVQEGANDEDFDATCQKIEEIHRLRGGLVSLQNTGKTALEKVKGVGAAVWHGNEVPVQTRLRDLKLMHELKLDGYQYEDEKEWIYSRLYECVGGVKAVGQGAYQNLTNNNNRLELLWRLFKLPGDVSEKTKKVLSKEFFDDFKVLMKHNPRLARNMAGDIAQSAAIVKQVFGDSSMLSRLFEQLDWRAWGETAQSYVNERFEHTACDYQQLSKEQKTSIKRMVALCQMLKETPTMLQVAKTGASVAKNIVFGSWINAAYEGVKGIAELCGVRKIQKDVSAMSDDQVKTLHMALQVLQGPEGAMAKEDALRKWADVFADSIKGRSVVNTYLRNSPLMRPFVFRLNRLTHAFRSCWHGQGSGRQLAWELGKVGLIAGGAIAVLGLSALTMGGLAAGLGVAALSWSTIGLITSFSIPTLLLSLAAGKPLGCPFLGTAHAIADKLMHLESLEAPAAVVKNLVQEMRKDPESELKQLQVRLEKAVNGAFQLNNQRMREHRALITARQTCLDTYRQHWDSLVFDDSDRAQAVVAEVENLQADDNEAFKQQAEQLQAKLNSWRLLGSFIRNIPSDSSVWAARINELGLDPSLKQLIGTEKQQLPYTVISALEMLQEEIVRDLGVELNWKEETVRNSETLKEITLDEKGVIQRLRDYQGRILLGDYLAGNYVPAYSHLSKVRQEAEEKVLKVSRKQCIEQATSLAEYLLRLAMGNLVSTHKDQSGQVDREKFIRSLDTNEPLKMALGKQLSYMKKAACHCINEYAANVHDSLKDLDIQIEKEMLKDFGNKLPDQSVASNDVGSSVVSETTDLNSGLSGEELAHVRSFARFVG